VGVTIVLSLFSEMIVAYYNRYQSLTMKYYFLSSSIIFLLSCFNSDDYLL